MSFDFETFQRSRRLGGYKKPPAVSITIDGHLLINKTAAGLLNAEHVQLLYDRQAQVIGLCSRAADEPSSYRVRVLASGGRVVTGIGFCTHFGIDHSQTRRYAARLVDGVLCVFLNEPDGGE